MLTDERIGQLTCDPRWSHIEVPLLADFARAIEAEVSKAEPVAWVDVLDAARPRCITSLDYMSVTEAKLGVRYIPLYAAPQPAAPCPKCAELEIKYALEQDDVVALKAKCAELEEESEYYRVNRDLSGHAYLDMLHQRDELVTKNNQQREWLIERDNYAESLRAEIATIEAKLQQHQAVLAEAEKALVNLLHTTPATLDCADLHHPKKYQHSYDAPCPVMALYEDARDESSAALASIKALKGEGK